MKKYVIKKILSKRLSFFHGIIIGILITASVLSFVIFLYYQNSTRKNNELQIELNELRSDYYSYAPPKFTTPAPTGIIKNLNDGFKQYTSNFLGITFLIPDNATLEESAGGNNPSVRIRYSPQEVWSKGYTFLIQRLSPFKNTSAFNTISELYSNEQEHNNECGIRDQTRVSDLVPYTKYNNAYMFTENPGCNKHGFSQYVKQIYIIDNEQIYSLRGTSDDQSNKTYIDNINRIIQSFDFIK